MNKVYENLGVNAKGFRKLLRAGKIPGARKDENGRWQFSFENDSLPTKESLGVNENKTPRIPGVPRVKKERSYSSFITPEYITDQKPHWFGLKVDGGREMEVKNSLDLAKIEGVEEVFVPTQVVVKEGKERVQHILTKIVFVKSNKVCDLIHQMKNHSSKIKGFWMSMPLDNLGNKVPALIDEETVNSLKELHNRKITDEQIHGLEINKMVEVISGPFKHTKGFIQGINGDIINIEIEILGRTLPIHLPSNQIKVIVEN